MTDLNDLNEAIAEAEAEYWPMVRNGEYDGPEAMALRDKIRALREERRALAGREA
jgi:hypothetical protein